MRFICELLFKTISWIETACFSKKREVQNYQTIDKRFLLTSVSVFTDKKVCFAPSVVKAT